MANPGAPASTLMLENECPGALDHIIQYTNTGSIRIPALSSVDAPLKATDITSAQAYKKGTRLPTLARIWFLADYFLIPYVQNIVINQMYRLLCCMKMVDDDTPYLVKNQRCMPSCTRSGWYDGCGVELGCERTDEGGFAIKCG